MTRRLSDLFNRPFDNDPVIAGVTADSRWMMRWPSRVKKTVLSITRLPSTPVIPHLLARWISPRSDLSALPTRVSLLPKP